MSSSELSIVRRFEVVDAERDDPVSMNDLPRVEIYTVQQVASLLGISETLAYEMVGTGKIPAKRLGRRWVIPRRSFSRWLNDLPSGA